MVVSINLAAFFISAVKGRCPIHFILSLPEEPHLLRINWGKLFLRGSEGNLLGYADLSGYQTDNRFCLLSFLIPRPLAARSFILIQLSIIV
jgi:hypothetical protein